MCFRAAKKDGRSILSEETVDLLETWRPDASLDDQKRLNSEGERELRLLAERFQRRLPHLLTSEYSPERFIFRATLRQRAKESQFHFATGLFGRNVAEDEVVFQQPVSPHDPLLRSGTPFGVFIINVCIHTRLPVHVM